MDSYFIKRKKWYQLFRHCVENTFKYAVYFFADTFDSVKNTLFGTSRHIASTLALKFSNTGLLLGSVFKLVLTDVFADIHKRLSCFLPVV